MADMEGLAQAVITGNANAAVNLTQQALDENVSPQTVLNDGLVAGMGVIGKRFKANEVYIPEVLIAARAMKSAMEVLEPKLAAAGVQPVAKALIGTVQGDLHDIGKNLVIMMLKGNGFEVIDAGVDVTPEGFVEQAKASGANLIGLSALLTTTMPALEKTAQTIRSNGVKAKIMIGGAPVTQAYADKIGADGYASDAASAVDLAQKLIAVH